MNTKANFGQLEGIQSGKAEKTPILRQTPGGMILMRTFKEMAVLRARLEPPTTTRPLLKPTSTKPWINIERTCQFPRADITTGHDISRFQLELQD